MGLHSSLGYIQIARNLAVVASLQQQIDDLLFPVPHSADRFFHRRHLTGGAEDIAGALGNTQSPLRTRKILVLSHLEHPRSQICQMR